MTQTASLLPAKRPSPPRVYPRLSEEEIRRIIKTECGGVFAETHGAGEHTVFILPEAFQELRSIVSYARRSPMNLCEQKFEGLGHFLTDGCGRIFAIVTHFIELHTTNRTPCSASNLGPRGEPNPGLNFLEYYREEFLRHEADCNTDAYGFTVDPFLTLCGPSEFMMEGHTHPDLSCFFSAQDKASGRARAASRPICNFVCDPIRKEMLGAIGADFAPAKIVVCGRASEAARAHGETPAGAEPPSASPEAPAPFTVPAQPDAPAVSALSAPPEAVGEMARLASLCLRERGCTGFVRMRGKRGGKMGVTIRLVCPQEDGG